MGQTHLFNEVEAVASPEVPDAAETPDLAAFAPAAADNVTTNPGKKSVPRDRSTSGKVPRQSAYHAAGRPRHLAILGRPGSFFLRFCLSHHDCLETR